MRSLAKKYNVFFMVAVRNGVDIPNICYSIDLYNVFSEEHQPSGYGPRHSNGWEIEVGEFKYVGFEPLGLYGRLILLNLVDARLDARLLRLNSTYLMRCGIQSIYLFRNKYSFVYPKNTPPKDIPTTEVLRKNARRKARQRKANNKQLVQKNNT